MTESEVKEQVKSFSCPKCGGQDFTLAQRKLTAVDFSREGAVEGHPFLRSVAEYFEGFICFNCNEEVPKEQAQEMLKEVV